MKQNVILKLISIILIVYLITYSNSLEHKSKYKASESSILYESYKNNLAKIDNIKNKNEVFTQAVIKLTTYINLHLK